MLKRLSHAVNIYIVYVNIMLFSVLPPIRGSVLKSLRYEQLKCDQSIYKFVIKISSQQQFAAGFI